MRTSAGGKEGSVCNVEAGHMPALAARVYDGVLGRGAHASCAHLVRREHGDAILADACTSATKLSTTSTDST